MSLLPASPKARLGLAAAGTVIIAGVSGVVGAQLAAPDLDPAAAARADRAGCQAWLDRNPTGQSTVRARMALCVADATAKLAALAQTPTPAGTTSSGPVSSSPVPPPPTASGSPLPSPIPTPTPVTGWPGAGNTGIPAGTVLTKQTNTNIIITTPDTVIDGWDIPGQIQIRANNVTIRNSRVHCATDHCIFAAWGIIGLHLLHDDVGPDSGRYTTDAVVSQSSGPAGANVVDGLNIHDVADGIRVDGGLTIINTWIHHLDITGDGAHSDGIQTEGGPTGANVLIKHNTIEGGNTSAVFVQGGGSSSWVIDGNLLLGRVDSGGISSYAVGFDVLSCPVGGCLFVNNVLNRTWASGPSYIPTIYIALTWYQNTWADNGATIPVP